MALRASSFWHDIKHGCLDPKTMLPAHDQAGALWSSPPYNMGAWKAHKMLNSLLFWLPALVNLEKPRKGFLAGPG